MQEIYKKNLKKKIIENVKVKKKIIKMKNNENKIIYTSFLYTTTNK